MTISRSHLFYFFHFSRSDRKTFFRIPKSSILHAFGVDLQFNWTHLGRLSQVLGQVQVRGGSDGQ